MNRTASIAAATASLALFACAPDLRTDHPFDGEVKTGPLVRVEHLPDGLRRTIVDATNKGSQVFLDLDQDRELKVDEAFSTGDWELSFKRFEIAMNGGSSSPGGTVEVAVLRGASFDQLSQAPAQGFQQDGAERVFNAVEGGWYFYDLGVHRLVARDDLVYVVRSTKGAYFKLRMLSYYGDSGTPAELSLEYLDIAAP